MIEATEAEVSAAFAADQLEVCYQPIVDLARCEVVSAQASIRWQHPSGAPVQLPECMPTEVERWLLHTATRQAATWGARGLVLELAINLSQRQAQDAALIATVQQALAESGLPPRLLLLALTERSLTEDDGTSAMIDQLATLGVGICVDRFGTGHSSLLHLKRYPVTVLRIDSTFVGGLGTSRDDEAIVSSVASLAVALGSRCIADGVTTQAQHDQLVALGCQAQGRWYSPAVTAAELPAALDLAESLLERAPEPVARIRGRERTSRAPLPELPARVSELMLSMAHDGASVQTIAAALNHAGDLHPAGKRWHSNSVAQYLAHLSQDSSASV